MFNKNVAIALLSLASAQTFSNSTANATSSADAGSSANTTTSLSSGAASGSVTSGVTVTSAVSGSGSASLTASASGANPSAPSAIYANYTAAQILSTLNALAADLIALLQAVLARRANTDVITAFFNFDEALYAAGYIFLTTPAADIAAETADLLLLLQNIATISNDLVADHASFVADGTAPEIVTYISNLYGFSATLFNTVGTKLTCPQFAAFAAQLDTTAFALGTAVTTYGASATINYPSYAAFCGTLTGISTSGSPVTTTTVVTAFTTYCPVATEITTNGKVYTVTEATTLVITDCPCTLTTVSCKSCVVVPPNTVTVVAAASQTPGAPGIAVVSSAPGAPVAAASSKTPGAPAAANGAANVGAKVAAVAAAAALPLLL